MNLLLDSGQLFYNLSDISDTSTAEGNIFSLANTTAKTLPSRINATEGGFTFTLSLVESSITFSSLDFSDYTRSLLFDKNGVLHDMIKYADIYLPEKVYENMVLAVTASGYTKPVLFCLTGGVHFCPPRELHFQDKMELVIPLKFVSKNSIIMEYPED